MPFLGITSSMLGSSLLGGASSAASGFLNSFFSNKQSEKNYELANKYAKDIATFNSDLQIAQWNRENQYNTPAAQMDRLRAAGLNPNLVYGNGAVGNTSTTGPRVSADSAKFEAQSMRIGDVLQAAQGVAQIRNIDADTAQKEANRRLIERRAEGQLTINDLKQLEYGLKSAGYNYSLDQLYFKTEMMRMEYERAPELFDAQLEKILLENDFVDQRLANNEEVMNRIKAQTRLALLQGDTIKLQNEIRELTGMEPGSDTLYRLIGALITGLTGKNMFEGLESLGSSIRHGVTSSVDAFRAAGNSVLDAAALFANPIGYGTGKFLKYSINKFRNR